MGMRPELGLQRCLLPGHGVLELPQEGGPVGALQVQLVLLLQQRPEQLQPKVPAWGRAGRLRAGARAPRGAAGLRTSPGSGHGPWGAPQAPPISPSPPSPGRGRHPPYSRALCVTRPLMPGLEPVAGEQAASRSRRQSSAGAAPLGGWPGAESPSSALGQLRDLGAGAEDMAEPPTRSPALYRGAPADDSLPCARQGHRGAPAAESPTLPNA